MCGIPSRWQKTYGQISSTYISLLDGVYEREREDRTYFVVCSYENVPNQESQRRS